MAALDENRWRTLSFIEQMANIGSEVGRTRKSISQGKAILAAGAFERALSLIDMTIEYGRENQSGRSPMLRELCRAREIFAGAYLSGNLDDLTYLDRYFGHFAMAYAR